MTRILAPFDPATDPLSEPLRRYFATGDEAAIEQVVAAVRPRLLAAARKIGANGSLEDAEDAVQAALLSLVRRRGTPLDAPVFPWLLTATIRTAYRRKAVARRDRALAERLAHEPKALAEGADADDLARLRAEVLRLPARYRDPVVLHDLVGLSTGETARLLDLPEATVRTRLHRARKLVRSRWSPVLTAGLYALPWFFLDRSRDAAAGSTALAAGGLMGLKLAAPLLALGVALGAGVVYLARPAGSSDDAERAKKAETEVATLRDRVKALEAEKDEALQKNAANLATAKQNPVAAAPAPADPAAPSATPATPPPEKPAAGKGPRFTIAGYEAGTQGFDWGEIGKTMKEMPTLTAAFADSYSKTGNLDPDQIGRLQQLNGPLVTAALKISKALNRDNANTAFTHPAFMANAIAATLEAAGLPLSEAQAKSIERIATDAATEEDRRLKAYDESAWALQKVIDDSEAREAFFAAVFALLTPEQSAALVPPSTKGRMQVDIFSSALLWSAYAAPLPFADKDALVAAMEQSESQAFPLPQEKRAAFHDAIVEWANGLPQDVLSAPPDPLSEKGFLPIARVLDAAKRTLALHQRIVDAARLDDAAAKRFRRAQRVLVPIHVAPAENR